MKTNNPMDLFNQYSKCSYLELKELFKKAESKEEQDFYMTLANLFLKTEQKKALKEMKI